MMDPDLFQRALHFAARAHQGQTVPGTELPYLTHLTSVALEVVAAFEATPAFDANLAVSCALLHDTIEDTATAAALLEDQFGTAVAAGVQALTKDPALPDAEARMRDSLRRIRQQPPEVAIVKLADRIVNLQPPPPHWTLDKCRRYREEARLILQELEGVNPRLEARLAARIEAYAAFTDVNVPSS